MSNKQVIVIGAGFSGLSAASFLAKEGYKVTLLEKHDVPGGRARLFKADGFTFDMGPSWYWMPDVFERYFAAFGKELANYYDLIRLDPSYRVFFEDEHVDMPASIEELRELFEHYEPGSGPKLDRFLKDAAYKYKVGIHDLVFKPSKSLMEFADRRVLGGLFKMHLFKSFSSYVRKYFTNPKLIELLEFPVLFLGAKPQNIPALYSLMNHADLALGTWYPMGGMHKIVEAMVKVAEDLGVDIRLGQNVNKITVVNGVAKEVVTDSEVFSADVVVGGADYAFIDQQLLEEPFRNYTPSYWDKRVMAPSSLLYYMGIDKKVPGLLHHNLFFDRSFGDHAIEIYDDPKWPTDPLFYVSAPSKTDASVAPEGKENLFLLIPIAPGLKEDEVAHERLFNQVMDRLEARTGMVVRESIIYKRKYSVSNFTEDYNAFRGNAYGLANTLRQTAILKPSLRNKKVKNLFYTGQLTVPGPGVPPSLISGEVVAREVKKSF